MIAVLVIAYASDSVRNLLRTIAGETFSSSVILQSLWIAVAANLILAACILTLAWFVCIRSRRDKILSALFLIVGLFLLLSPSLSLLLAPFIRWPLPFGFPLPDSLLFHVAAFVVAIGIANLIVRR